MPIDQSAVEMQSEWKTNEDFWAEFLAKNLVYQTEPFGGNNPLFIPFRTEVKDYEDNYVHNQHIIPKVEVRDLPSSADLPLDINFVRNLETETEEGYGACTG